MGEFIRYEDPAQLFTDGAQHGNVKVNSNIGETWLQKSYWNGKVAIVAGPNEYVNAAHERDLSSGTDDEGWAHHHLEAVERDVQTVDYEWPVPVLKGQLSENGNYVR